MSRAMNNLNNGGKYNSKVYEHYRLNFEMSDEQKKKISEAKNKEIILEDGTITTSAKLGAQKMLKTMNYKLNGIKGSSTKNKEIILEDGTITTSAKLGGEKCSKTKKQIIETEFGNITKGKLSVLKAVKTLSEVEENGKSKRCNINSKTTKKRSEEYWDEDQGIYTTHYKEVAKKRVLNNLKFVKLYHKDKGYIKDISLKDARELHASLLKANEKEYLGCTKKKLNLLIKNDKLDLLGLYIKKGIKC